MWESQAKSIVDYYSYAQAESQCEMQHIVTKLTVTVSREVDLPGHAGVGKKDIWECLSSPPSLHKIKLVQGIR